VEKRWRWGSRCRRLIEENVLITCQCPASDLGLANTGTQDIALSLALAVADVELTNSTINKFSVAS